MENDAYTNDGSSFSHVIILADNTLNVVKLHLPIFGGQCVWITQAGQFWIIFSHCFLFKQKAASLATNDLPTRTFKSLSPGSVWLAAQEGHILFSTGYLL